MTIRMLHTRILTDRVWNHYQLSVPLSSSVTSRNLSSRVESFLMSVKLSPFAERTLTTAVTTSALSISRESTMQVIFFQSEEDWQWQAYRGGPGEPPLLPPLSRSQRRCMTSATTNNCSSIRRFRQIRRHFTSSESNCQTNRTRVGICPR